MMTKVEDLVKRNNFVITLLPISATVIEIKSSVISVIRTITDKHYGLRDYGLLRISITDFVITDYYG